LAKGLQRLRQFHVPDPGLPRLRRVVNRLTTRRAPVFPRTIQIQTTTGCNADCVFCPYGETYSELPKGRMDWGMYTGLLEESARHGTRRISPYLMNEPFADPEIIERIAAINQIHPRAKVVLTTNGSLLGEEKARRLLDLGDGVHEIYFSVQGIEKESYESTMRGALVFEKTLANIDRFLRLHAERRGRRPIVWVTMVDTGTIDAREAVAYWSARGVRAKYTRLENRGGNIAGAEELSRAGEMRPFTGCTRLMKQAYVLFNGDVVLCCTDYRKTMVLGNVAEGGLQAVWNGPRAAGIRRDYQREDFSRNPLCGSCTVDLETEISVVPRGLRTLPRRAASL
jgi:MoaA/NifB/PqqE/SkfB family radical SAM enzyme